MGRVWVFGARRRGILPWDLELELAWSGLDAIMARTVAEGTLADRMGISIVSASAARVVATMPAAGNTQPQGLMHGGASCVLAETAGSLGAFLHAGGGRTVVGIEISATHHRGARDGEVTAVATLVHGGGPPRVHVPADLPDQRPGARPGAERHGRPG